MAFIETDPITGQTIIITPKTQKILPPQQTTTKTTTSTKKPKTTSYKPTTPSTPKELIERLTNKPIEPEPPTPEPPVTQGGIRPGGQYGLSENKPIEELIGPQLTPLEQVISRTNPEMAMNIYNKRTEGGTTSVSVAPTDYKKTWGYTPSDAGYSTEISNVSSELTQQRQTEFEQIQWLSNYKQYISTINSNISTIQNAPDGTTFSIGDKTGLSREQAIAYYNTELNTINTTARTIRTNLPLLETNIKDLSKTKGTLEAYQGAGYVFNKSDDGYYFTRPKASEVVKYVYGGDRPDIYIASELRTLGMGVLFSGAQQLLTGQQSLEANKEATADNILGTTRMPGESIEAFSGRFWTSTDVILDVYVPLATLGISKGITMAGRVIAPKAIALGGRIAGEVGPTGSKILSGTKYVASGAGKILSSPAGLYTMKYGIYGAMEAPAFIETAVTQPELIGSQLGKSLTRYEVSWGMMDVGFAGGIKSKQNFIESDIRQTMNIPESVQQQQSIGIINVAQRPLEEGEISFMAGGKVVVKTDMKAPVEINVKAYGISRETELIQGVQTTESQGRAIYSWSETKGLTKYDYLRVRPIESNAFEVGQLGDKRLIASVDAGMGNVEPTIGEGITSVSKLTETEGMTAELYASRGTYSNIIEDVIGKQRTTGVILTKTSKEELTEFAEKGYGLVEKPGAGFKGTPWKFENKGSSLINTLDKPSTGAEDLIGAETKAVTKETPAINIGSKLTSEASKIVEESETGAIYANPLFGPKITLRELEGMEMGIQTSSHWNTEKPSTNYISKPNVTLQRPRTSQSLQQGTMSLTNTLEGVRTENIIDFETETDNKQDEYTKPLTFTGEITGQDLGTENRQDFGIGTNQGLNTSSKLGQEMRQEFGQQYKTKTVSELTTIGEVITTPPTPKPGTPHPRIPRFPRRKKDDDDEIKYYKSVRRQRDLIKKTTKGRKKGLPADLLSVTQSQARYGESTQPRLTKKVWSESEKTLFKRTPTEELMKGGKTKADNLIGNKKIKGGKKNVYY